MRPPEGIWIELIQQLLKSAAVRMSFHSRCHDGDHSFLNCSEADLLLIHQQQTILSPHDDLARMLFCNRSDRRSLCLLLYQLQQSVQLRICIRAWGRLPGYFAPFRLCRLYDATFSGIYSCQHMIREAQAISTLPRAGTLIWLLHLVRLRVVRCDLGCTEPKMTCTGALGELRDEPPHAAGAGMEEGAFSLRWTRWAWSRHRLLPTMTWLLPGFKIHMPNSEISGYSEIREMLLPSGRMMHPVICTVEAFRTATSAEATTGQLDPVH